MKEKKLIKIVTYLLKNSVNAQDIYFGWRRLFDMMVDIEQARKGLLVKEQGETIHLGGGESKKAE